MKFLIVLLTICTSTKILTSAEFLDAPNIVSAEIFPGDSHGVVNKFNIEFLRFGSDIQENTELGFITTLKVQVSDNNIMKVIGRISTAVREVKFKSSSGISLPSCSSACNEIEITDESFEDIESVLSQIEYHFASQSSITYLVSQSAFPTSFVQEIEVNLVLQDLTVFNFIMAIVIFLCITFCCTGGFSKMIAKIKGNIFPDSKSESAIMFEKDNSV